MSDHEHLPLNQQPKFDGINETKSAGDATDFHEPKRDASPVPSSIGRYRVQRELGRGAFGCVFLASDGQLDRDVAIKVPHPELMKSAQQVELYLTEARTVASLDHPHIAAVYDVGSSDDVPFYVVSKLIPGQDLKKCLKDSAFSIVETIEVVATMAEALHYAHKRGIVHRDVKPGNILLDEDGKPFLVDFGLALKERDLGKGPHYAGTPAYMSPEQARGEGHRVDGRSDIFSLGVVLYQLLTGRRPFKADSTEALLEQINTQEAKPPRQIDDAIPKEVERICLKALAKRASERYTTAFDLADDLRHFIELEGASLVAGGEWSVAGKEMARSANADADSTHHSSPTTRPPTPATHHDTTTDSRPLKIVPKGLRSFDAHDADFFLELLPGARDREGLPDSIRFWKTRIEETDRDETFSVGLIYGPSGCGKSSLVKAGLLPRLSSDVISVYIEATPDETESRLLHGLRKRCPALEDGLGLVEMLAALRRGQGLPAGKKVLIVLDQFEQWLHAKKEEEHTELVKALRQCDGGSVQCIVMVRDDFWLAVSRFLRDLEVRLVEGENSALADLFDLDHARKVLSAFGRAFGKLPEAMADTNREQTEFLAEAIAGLAEEGKVICVRLSLFAEMMKGKTWAPAVLRKVGGTQGVGMAFLEETFSASTAPPEHRYHQKAARAVLRALLPDKGTDIKGHMRSRAELLEASGYASRPKDFEDLLRILDSEIRLITPTDPEGMEEVSDGGWRVEREEGDWGDGGSQLPRIGSLAAGDEIGGGMLPSDQVVSSGGDVRIDESNSPGSGFDSSQHRGGARTGAHEGVFEVSRDREGLTHGVGDASDIESTRGTDRPGAAKRTPQSNRPDQSNVERTPQGTKAKVRSVIPTTHHASPTTRYYQLTHDYLVPSLREWLTRKQKETRQGRAELALADRAAVWHARQENRQLPSLLQWWRIRWYTDAKRWTEPQRQMMRKAGRVLGTQATLAASVTLVVVVAVWQLLAWQQREREQLERQTAQRNTVTAVDSLQAASGSAIPFVLEKLDSLPRDMVLAEIQSRFPDATSQAKLSLAYGLSHFQQPEFDAVMSGLIDAETSSDEVMNIVRAMLPDRDEFVSRLTTAAAAATQEEDWVTKTRLAVVALYLDEPSIAAEMLRIESDKEAELEFDPVERTEFIKMFATWSGELSILVESVEDSQIGSLRSGLALASGGIERPNQEAREVWGSLLVDWFTNAPDSGTHSASGWALNRWNLAKPELEWSNKPNSDRDWWQTEFFTMVLIPKGSVQGQYGVVSAEADFWISDREVTLAAFERFIEEALTTESPQDWSGARDFGNGSQHDHPAQRVGWYGALMYCNWLSRKYGFLPCYSLRPLVGETREYQVKLTSDGNGFRLPTEMEWELACRAKSTTAFAFGNFQSDLSDYGWYDANSEFQTHAACKLRCNPWGLFDMHGNVFEWCWVPDSSLASNRMFRGGGWDYQAMLCNSSQRVKGVPSDSFSVGFRVALGSPSKSQ